MAVTAHSPGSGTVQEVGDGGYMTSCATSGSAVLVTGVSAITVHVSPGTCSGTTTQLAGGVYTVSFANAGLPCMDPILDPGANGTDVGAMAVHSSGFGSGTFVTPSLNIGTLGVCITGPIDTRIQGIPAQGGGVTVSVI